MVVAADRSGSGEGPDAGEDEDDKMAAELNFGSEVVLGTGSLTQ